MVKHLVKQAVIVLTLCLLLPNSVCHAAEKQVAIVIDDFGNDVKGAQSFLQGNFPITVAIMPFLDQSTEQAAIASKNGLEVIIHLPLEPKKGKKSWLGPGAITTDLSDEQINDRLHRALTLVPQAKGLNNHMGSKVMEDRRIVTLIVKFAKDHNLYLIDSKTTPHSVMPEIASDHNVPCFPRSTFLDDTLSSYSHVKKQLINFAEEAPFYDHPIAIGHVGIKGEQTYNAITDSLSMLAEHDLKLVFPSIWTYPQVEQDLISLTKGEYDFNETRN
ncbi:hypothetical protein JCM19046_3989 [Bacillus sp. JCM 19046]|nr:hypothetical protein JCM19045_1209 [Bacillus sp. JCM 19045]GAF19344.1 hypothetical protein JCM19046_3989 [Bacillus sp. JCM 19046]